LKVLFLHNFYQSSSPSGEDAVYDHEVEMLRTAGVEIVRYERHNDEIRNPLHVAFGAVWSRRTYREITSLIHKEKPDVAHFHNIWYLISPSAYYACKEAGVPVVQTLHNYRMFCANGLLLRDGKTCEDCIGKMPWRGVVHGCYRNSRLYSVPVAASEWFHWLKRTWTETVDGYIALTGFGKKKFIECGLPAEKIYVKPNFLSDPPIFLSSPDNYAVFIGRLSREKGVDVLLDALHTLKSSHPHNFSPFSFKIVGDGPMRQQIMGRCEDMKMGKWRNGETETAKGEGQRAKGLSGGPCNVELLGRKSQAECMALLSRARFMVTPSVCYENFPLTIPEAFACGKPVIASNLGAMAQIVEHGKTGLLFEPGNAGELAKAIRRLWEDEELCLEMGRNVRAEFEARYTAEHNFEMLMGIYAEVMKIRG
jgi:glycosyltransferase involved in cell wall biosynthesis